MKNLYDLGTQVNIYFPGLYYGQTATVIGIQMDIERGVLYQVRYINEYDVPVIVAVNEIHLTRVGV
jgi:hypothetical protein